MFGEVRANKMKITIIYDNEVAKKGLKEDWGFSCLIDVGGKKILFDTGADGSILLDNMKKLGIYPAIIEDVFISHDHWDHTGGLSSFLNQNSNVKVYVPVSLGIRGAEEVISVSKPINIHENIFSTGELEGIEQSMAIKTEKGIVVIVGCSHPGVKNILKAASQFGEPYAIIGGLHGFNEFDLIKDLALICPTHCTQFKSEIKVLYPEKCIDGGVGKIIEI
jgi:7,8-dihydropterin-6-yl-methyl-4-(beta-D-ribofuranosyl)aminobenzene 5'-phosphate synthase